MSNFWIILSVLLFALVLLTIFGLAYLHITAKNKERLALIEKGMDPNLANSDFWTQIGIIAGGSALGLYVDDQFSGGYGPLVAIILAGGGIVTYNILKRRSRHHKL